MPEVLMRDRAPDLILTGGLISTIDPDLPEAEAIAIKDGRVLAVGSAVAINDIAGPGTVVRHLGGRRVIPGINDTHNHLLSTGLVLNQVSLYDARSIADIQEAVAAKVATSPPGAWILGRGWDESLLTDGRFPNRHDLDEVAPNNPVVLERVWNMLLANSAAMLAADIGRNTPDPPSDQLYAGRIDRDDNGEPTGVFRDRAKFLITAAIPAYTMVDLERAVQTACAEYNRLGITSIAEPGLTPDRIRAFQNVRRSGSLTVRSSLCLAGWGATMEPEQGILHERFEHVGFYTGFGDDLLRLDTIKFMPDGGVGDRTALMFEPYWNDPDNYGQFVVSEAEIFKNVRWAHERGWSIDAHTCGDRMQEIMIRAYADAYEANPNSSVRHRVHHGYFPTETSLSLMQKHQIPALATIPFITNLGESWVASLGEERTAGAMPLRTYLNAGVPLALGSDSPVTTYNPFTGMYAATTRKTVSGRQLGPRERISREEALRYYTATSAWVTSEDSIKGSLSPGKLADVAVLNKDVFEVADDELPEISSVLTLLGGIPVYDVLK